MSEETKAIANTIDLTEERFKQIAPQAISYEAEKGFAMQLLTNNSYLMKAAQENPASLAQAITNVAAIGLSLNPAERQAYLLPRNVREGNQWITRIFLEPSYMGLIKLATDSGSIEWVQARMVYKNDNFVDNGVGEKPTHVYKAFDTPEERGEFVGVYCVAKTHGGDHLTHMMPASKVHDIMERSETIKKYRLKNSQGFGGPWITDFEEQAKKTVIRQAFKTWPRTNTHMAEAVHLSDVNEGFDPILTSPQVMDYTADQKAYYDQLIEKSDALEMFVLQSTIEDAVRTNLYHSFESGSKGKYQQIVDSLYRSGASIFADCVTTINEAEDDATVLEIIEDLSADALELIKDKIEPDALEMLREVTA